MCKIASKTNEELKSTQTKDELLPVISSFISSVLSNSIDQLEIEQEKRNINGKGQNKEVDLVKSYTIVEKVESKNHIPCMM